MSKAKVTVFFIKRPEDDAPLVYFDATMFPNDDSIDKAIQAGLYEKAAVVSFDVRQPDAEMVWTTIQNLDEPWTKSPNVEVITTFPRSMMVGDIIYDHDADAWAFVASFGFEPVWQESSIDKLTELL